MTPIQQLYRYFSDLMKPTGAQFRALIDSFWHKSEKIPISSIDGLDKLVEGTASARQLQNHINDTHAHKELLDKKVDKVPGKKLTTEDFTTELRQKLEGLQQVDISLLLPRGNFTGTAQDLKDLIDGLTRILQSPDTELDELREIVAYIKQNKHILSTLGINNIAGLEEALANKADKDHNHDERYAPITHHHNEYALRTHRHNKDDIDGLPNNLATTDNIKTAIEGIHIGGRNLVLKSKLNVTNSHYGIVSIILSEEPKVGEKLTVTIKGVLGSGKRVFTLYNKSGSQELCVLQDKGNGIFQSTFNWRSDPTNPKLLVIYIYDSSVVVNSTIEWIKIERGNTATDWSPAPEDLEGYWSREKGSPYGDCITTLFPIIIKEIYFDNQGSKANLWTANNELNVGSRNIGGHSRINCNGYKINGKDDNYVLLAGGESIHKNLLLGRKGYVSDGGTLNQQDHSNSTIFVRSGGNFELSPLENLTSCSFIKVFDGGNVTFSCSGKTIIMKGDTQFNGGKGSTAVVSIHDNDCYIRISNV